jgi:protocatechuate 3,4-dioxygenase alpha subunit
MSAAERLVATSSQTVGPFFHFALTARPEGRMIDRFPAGGEPMTLRIAVRDGDGQPVVDAMIEVWQAGVFGRMPTAPDGTCEFETIRPTARSDGRAAHINVCLFARGLLRQIHTRIYFDGDPEVIGDPVLALVPEDRRRSLLATSSGDQPSVWLFDIHLQGPQETVFFDV